MSDQSLTLATLFTADISDFLSKIRQVRNEFARFATASGQLSSSITSLNQNLNKNVNASNTASQAIRELNKARRDESRYLAESEGWWGRLGLAMQRVTDYGLATAVIYKTVEALRSGVVEVINFDQSLKNLQAITGATDAELAQMGDTILATAKRTRYSSVEAAEGMVLLGQAGFTAAESMQAIDAVADLATGTLSNLEQTTDLVSTTIMAFGMNAIESSRVVDVMANAINKSKLDVDKLRTAFNYVGAAASETGLTLEETAASMMVLANHGLRASTIGTGFRQVLSKLVAPTRKIKDTFEEYGLSIDQINPKIVGFQKAMETLRSVLVDDKGMVNMTKAFELFEMRGAQAAAILVKSFGAINGSFEEMLEKTYDVGSANEMMEIQAEGLEFKLKNLSDRLKMLAISIGNAGLTGAMKFFVDMLRSAVDAVTKFTDSAIGATIIQIGVWTAAIYGAGGALKFLFGVITGSGIFLSLSNLITVFSTLSITMGVTTAAFTVLRDVLMGNFWGLLITTITAAGVALYHFNNISEKALIEQERLSLKLKQASDSLGVYISAIESTKGEGREFSSVVERLRSDHEDLSKVIDLNIDSYEDLIEALKKVQEQKQIEAIKSQIKEFELLNKTIGTLKENYDYLSTDYISIRLGADPIVKSMKEFVKNSKEGANAVDGLSTKYASFSRQIYQTLNDDNKTNAGDVARSYLSQYISDHELVEQIMVELNKNFEEFEKKRQKASEQRAITASTSQEVTSKELAQENKYYQLMGQMAEDDRRRITQDYNQRSVDIDKWYKDETERLLKLNQSKEEADEKYIELSKQNKRKFDQDNAKLELDSMTRSIEIKHQELVNKIELEKQAGVATIKDKDEIKKKEIQINNGFLSQNKQAYEEYYQKIVNLFGQESKEAIAAKSKVLQASIDLEKSMTSLVEEEVRGRQRIAQEDIDLSLKRINLKKIEEKQAIELEKQRSLGDTSKLSQIKQKEIAIEIKFLGDVVSLYEAHSENISRIYGKESVEAIDAKTKWAEAATSLSEKVTEQNEIETKKRIKQEISELKQRLEITQKYSKEWFAIIESMYKMEGISGQQYYRVMQERQESLLDAADRGFRRGATSAEAYLKAITDALEYGVISEQEAAKRRILINKDWLRTYQADFNLIAKDQISIFDHIASESISAISRMGGGVSRMSKAAIADVAELINTINEAKEATGSWGRLFSTVVMASVKATMQSLQMSWAQFKLGIDEARDSMMTWGEVMFDIGVKFPSIISNNLTDGLFDFIDGTKNAKDAFADFAKSTIKWLAEMIVRQQIYNAIVGFLPSSTVTAQYPGALDGLGGPSSNISKTFATGGWLNEPIIGRGLLTGSAYTLAEKGPELVVPQSKASSHTSNEAAGANVKIVVNNNTGVQANVKQEGPHWDGQQYIVSVWLDALERNKYGLRSVLRGA